MQGSGRFDERAANEPLSREAPYGAPQHVTGYGYYARPRRRYGSGRRYGYGPRGFDRAGYGGPQTGPIETRPFFLTSEFLGVLLAIVALGITAGTMDIVDARLTWILTAALVFGYVLSRGLAKAGSSSRSVDPREELLRAAATSAGTGGGGDGQQGRHGTSEAVTEPYGYAPSGGVGYAGSAGSGLPLETKPFFLTSEFLATLLAVLSVALTAAAMPNLGARLTWILITALVFTYAISRGLAKAGTKSHSFDPREELLRRGGGGGPQQPHPGGTGTTPGGSVHAIETKPFFVTSEFVGTLLAIVAIAISAAAIDILNVRLTWILIAAMVSGYVLSRGIAKIGVGSHMVDPRDELFMRTADGAEPQREPASQQQ